MVSRSPRPPRRVLPTRACPLQRPIAIRWPPAMPPATYHLLRPAGGTRTPPPPPPAAVGIAAAVAGSSGANLSWGASTDNVGVTGYIVRRNGVQVATPATTSFADTGLTAATYSYTVAARDAAGNISPDSASV